MVTNKFLRLSCAYLALSFLLLSGIGCQQTQVQPAEPNGIAPELIEVQTEGTLSEQTMLEEQREQAVSLYVDAMMLNDLNEREKAIQKLNMAVNLDPEFALAFSLKGDILQDMENFEESADAYERATVLDPW
ncbi:MAG: hypothetical protein ISS71_04245 [Phycisphaerae bacterium]|nr:hypothetical protein [Phycisphaerae bacterium]